MRTEKGWSRQLWKVVRCLLTAAVVAAVAAIPVGWLRVEMARNAAGIFAEEHKVSLDYHVPDKLGGFADCYEELYRLADWADESRRKLNGTYGYGEGQFTNWEPAVINGFEKKNRLAKKARKAYWYEQRIALEDAVQRAITELYAHEELPKYFPEEDVVRTAWQKGIFAEVVQLGRALEKDKELNVYTIICAVFRDMEGRPKEQSAWRALPVDVGYGMASMEVIAIFRENLQKAVDKGDESAMRAAAKNVRRLADRYGIQIALLNDVESELSSLDYARMPAVPEVGMSTWRAERTKLGAPTRKTTESGSWAHKSHTYGDMYWEKYGRQIFRASYMDERIDQVWDTRTPPKKTSSSGRISSKGSSATKGTSGGKNSSFDPDEHDIEAYYEDNRDEYDDYDDAYDGFLDDEGEWDNY